MKCPECKKELYESYVCTNCGLVVEPIYFDFGPVKIMDIKNKEKVFMNEWSHPLDPSIQVSHNFPTKSRNPTLRRAFNLQRREQHKGRMHDYMKTFLELKKICSFLNLPKNIFNEVINIYKCIIKKNRDFFKKNGRKPSYLAFIKIACRIHEFPLKNSQLIELVDYKVREKRTTAYMDKKFNKAYINAIKILGITFKIPEHPKYIDYVCNVLNLPYGCATRIHEYFTRLKNRIGTEYKLEGYILALYYILYKKEFKLTLDLLEEMFEVSRITISNRRNELLKVIKW